MQSQLISSRNWVRQKLCWLQLEAKLEVAFAATAGRHASCSEHECGAQSSARHTSTSEVGGRLTGGEWRGAGRHCARTPRPAHSPPPLRTSHVRRPPARDASRLPYHAARRAASFLLMQLRAFRHCHTSARPVDIVEF
ncbi:jg18472 [Pararge aegeria aegeria]|uniref:Jg18472 protein n=1 Tax=Pararge aegeria aegeria TaxID=348720 RepID=A0A8S4RKL6_9NEOP|nr:jg18472 [Pararge aegeria aegeria]